MPSLRRIPKVHPPRPSRPASRGGVLVLGDLVLDVVVAPARALEHGTDVPGRVSIHQGGSAANTARWLARLGVPTQLVGSVGRDAAGRALVAALRADGVGLRIVRAGTARTGRIGVLIGADGERSFVADRGAADAIEPGDLRTTWFRGVGLVHLPAYSLLGAPLGLTGRAAVRLARDAGALVSVDLASIGPLLAGGRAAALSLISEVGPDLLFATAAELSGLLGAGPDRPGGSARPGAGPGDAGGAALETRALLLAPIVVVKRGPDGASVAVRAGLGGSPVAFHVATRPIAAADTTGAGDAFDAGFIAEWLASRAAGRSTIVGLRRAAVAGNRVAARQVSVPRRELQLG